jgi:hypothetical protein
MVKYPKAVETKLCSFILKLGQLIKTAASRFPGK